jgi:uncharacterized membrane protein HdeD (DUF308 family)
MFKLILLFLSLSLSLLGLLSIFVAVAYWENKGAGLAATSGALLILLGVPPLVKLWRSTSDPSKNPRDRVYY